MSDPVVPGPSDEEKIQFVANFTRGDNAEGFPKTVVTGIWDRVFKGSVIQRHAGAVPVSLNGTAIPVPMGQPLGGFIGEGESKPIGELSVGLKTLVPHKLALIVVMSEEAIRANPLGAFDSIQAQMAEGLARAIDVAVIHGRDALTGATIAGADYLTSTTNEVEVDLSDTKPGVLADALVEAQMLVTENEDTEEDWQFNTLLASGRMRQAFLSARDTTGRPLYEGSLNLNSQVQSIFGLTTEYTRALRGYGQVNDRNLLAIGGDFGSNLRLGFEQNFTWDVAREQAGGIDLFGRNLLAYRIEANVGWVMRDPAAFAKLTLAA